MVDQLTEAQEQLYALEQQFTAINDRVDRATVRAPVGGTVLNLQPNTIGGVVRQGDFDGSNSRSHGAGRGS